MNLLVIGHENDLIIGYLYRLKCFISCPNIYIHIYIYMQAYH